MRPEGTQMCVEDDTSEHEAREFWESVNRLRYVEAIRLASDILEVAVDRGWVMKDAEGLEIDSGDIASLLCDMAENAVHPL